MKLQKEQLQKNVSLNLCPKWTSLICQQGYDRSYGARPLKRALVHLVEDFTCEAFLADNYQAGDIALVDLDAFGNPFVTCHRKPNCYEHGIFLSVATCA